MTRSAVPCCRHSQTALVLRSWETQVMATAVCAPASGDECAGSILCDRLGCKTALPPAQIAAGSKPWAGFPPWLPCNRFGRSPAVFLGGVISADYQLSPASALHNLLARFKKRSCTKCV